MMVPESQTHTYRYPYTPLSVIVTIRPYKLLCIPFPNETQEPRLFCRLPSFVFSLRGFGKVTEETEGVRGR